MSDNKIQYIFLHERDTFDFSDIQKLCPNKYVLAVDNSEKKRFGLTFDQEISIQNHEPLFNDIVYLFFYINKQYEYECSIACINETDLMAVTLLL